MAEIERALDEEVHRLYGISDEDKAAIEAELAEHVADDDPDADSNGNGKGDGDAGDHDYHADELVSEGLQQKEDLAQSWISSAVGIVMGRFQPGVKDGLGRGNFPDETNQKLKALADPDAILVMDKGHPDDLTAKVLECLSIMLGSSEAEEVVKSATGSDGPAGELLSKYFEKNFFKEHIQRYRKRPVYWFLQSPGKAYGIWIFHERMTKDTLFRIRTEYVEHKIKLLESQIADMASRKKGASGREERALDREMSNLTDILDDVREFAKLIKNVTDHGYTPHIDDGVLINMAPLWELIPSWQKEPKEAWESLEKGEWDWSYQAMDHWPDRVKAKCKTNKSYAVMGQLWGGILLSVSLLRKQESRFHAGSPLSRG